MVGGKWTFEGFSLEAAERLAREVSPEAVFLVVFRDPKPKKKKKLTRAKLARYRDIE